MTDPDDLRLAVMAMAENFTPMHEMAEGEVACFLRQGFTVEQAHAMAAAEFVTFFGTKIRNGATMPGDEENPHSEE